MSSYKCQLCYLAFKINEERQIVNYECECGCKICHNCITYFNDDKFTCNKCAGKPSEVLDPDYDCVCELCGLYNGDGFGIEIDEHGIECYMCSCCKNGCYNSSADEECRCLEISLAGQYLSDVDEDENETMTNED
jgi:hypothetical protein